MAETVHIRKRILEANDQEAARLRKEFASGGTLVVNLVSSPGSGKTTLLEATVARLRDDHDVAVVVGDIATERDAERIRKLGVPAHQIVTGGACHLDARMVTAALAEADLPDVDVLFIENVGNLVCPASYDLGEDLTVVALSVTEGEDKPFKYPAIFSRADAVLVTKSDLLQHVPFAVETVRAEVATLNPNAEFLVMSAASGEGFEAWCTYLLERSISKKEERA